MSRALVDSNVILDVFGDDPTWAEWSTSILDEHSVIDRPYINSIIYTEVSIGFDRIEGRRPAADHERGLATRPTSRQST